MGNWTSRRPVGTTVGAGKRDRLVVIEYVPPPVDDTGTSGFPVDTWVPLGSPVWMEKADIAAEERFRAGQISAPFQTRWEMPFRADMDPEVVNVPKLRRLVYRGRTYDITAANQIGRREGIELLTVAT